MNKSSVEKNKDNEQYIRKLTLVHIKNNHVTLKIYNEFTKLK
jgi:hypothetical protein